MYNVYLVEVIAGHSIEETHNVGKAVVGERTSRVHSILKTHIFRSDSRDFVKKLRRC